MWRGPRVLAYVANLVAESHYRDIGIACMNVDQFDAIEADSHPIQFQPMPEFVIDFKQMMEVPKFNTYQALVIRFSGLMMVVLLARAIGAWHR